ncbi:sensor histidine kinase [Embleya hyalina]|uniref:histidine kinase n=1 Tax=Embleya hyalina TaxID=516124 RepID=A0A401YS89_9ACTN|nr:sensor histidine kinase [Embleya hyalina]GCD97478.1 histidine kinase [Embleya hyalina]
MVPTTREPRRPLALPGLLPALRRLPTQSGLLARAGAGGLLALSALPAVVVVGVLCLTGLGVPLLPPLMRGVRRLAGMERRRVGAVLGGPPVPERYRPVEGSPVARARGLLTDRAGMRDLCWLPVHALTGTLAASLGLGLALAAVNDVTMPLWWWAIPGRSPSGVGFAVDSWGRAAVMLPIGVLVAVLACALIPPLLRGQARLSRRLLTPPANRSVAERLAEVTASRAAALDAHAAELRRIERDLHDGTQNRLLAVVMHLGLIERALERDPEQAPPLVRRARQAATGALDELREVVRGIYPPILDERGLDGAVAALAARSPVPCVVDTACLGRAPAAVETAAYFIVAEALNNVARHSRAEHVGVRLANEEGTLVIEVEDDGRGGADERAGSGVVGMRRRADALDGRVTLRSPAGGPTRLRAELPCGW